MLFRSFQFSPSTISSQRFADFLFGQQLSEKGRKVFRYLWRYYLNSLSTVKITHDRFSLKSAVVSLLYFFKLSNIKKQLMKF